MKKWKEDIALIRRSLREIHKIAPGLPGMILLQSAFTAFAPFITMYMSSLIINGIEEKREWRQLLFLVAATITAGLLVHLLGSFFGHLLNLRQSLFWERYEMGMGGKLMEMDYMDVESVRIHHLRQQIEDFENTGGEGLQNVLYRFWDLAGKSFTLLFSVSFVIALFTARFQGEASGVLAFAVSPWATILLLLAIGANAFAGMSFGRKMTEKSHSLLGQASGANRIYCYYLDNHILTYHPGKDVRIYNQKGLLKEEAAQMYGAGVEMVKGQVKNEAKYTGAVAFCSMVLSTLVYLFVGFRALAGMIGVGEMVLYIGSISRFTDGFSGFVLALTGLRTNNDAMKIYFEFMDTPAGMKESLQRADTGKNILGMENRTVRVSPTGAENMINRDAKQPKTTQKAEQEIEFRDVSFRYPDTEAWALRHISLKFRAGERLAVVGRNGSGKTTFIKLLCRLYDPTEGSILVDGRDIRTYGLEEYRKLFSVVFQDYRLFSFSLAQNVAAQMQADPDRAAECLQRAGFGERLLRMPFGMDTCLYKDFEETGVEISGGEAQKIALARALYKDAPIIVLDEPTAALDPIAEFEIYSRFNEIIGDKTAIYISHRLSSCKFCDDIAVFDGGALIQRGSHEELVAARDGKYYELWHAQAQHYAAGQ